MIIKLRAANITRETLIASYSNQYSLILHNVFLTTKSDILKCFEQSALFP